MKRVYLILTLFMTSFFLLSTNVSADTIDLEVDDNVLDYINDEFINVIKLSSEVKEKEQRDFIIYKQSDKLYLIFFKEAYLSLDSNNSYISITFVQYNTYRYNSSSNSFSFYNTGSTMGYKFINNITDINPTLNYKYYLYNSSNIINNSGYDLNINYNDKFFLIKDGTNLPTLYDLYSNYNSSQEEIDPKAEIVTNFYVLIIDKIKLLTNYIATDYIILSALVIFIFVAVIGLVRRLK